jgi:hypothetical protein
MEILQTFEYNGQQLQIATYKPEDSPRPARSASRRAPGAGKFEIGQIKLSSATISAGEELTLTAQVSGRHIAQIYTELLLQDKGSNQLYGPVMRNYVQAERNKVTGGVSRPDWDETIHLSLRLHPGLRLLTDGSDSAFGFLLPSGYDSSDYCLDGLYTASAETSRRARITFDSAGKITQALAFKDAESAHRRESRLARDTGTLHAAHLPRPAAALGDRSAHARRLPGRPAGGRPGWNADQTIFTADYSRINLRPSRNLANKNVRHVNCTGHFSLSAGLPIGRSMDDGRGTD